MQWWYKLWSYDNLVLIFVTFAKSCRHPPTPQKKKQPFIYWPTWKKSLHNHFKKLNIRLNGTSTVKYLNIISSFIVTASFITGTCFAFVSFLAQSYNFDFKKCFDEFWYTKVPTQNAFRRWWNNPYCRFFSFLDVVDLT